MKITKQQLKQIIQEELAKETLLEAGHDDVASTIRSMKTVIEDALDIRQELKGGDPELNLPTWWIKKIATAAAALNSCRDYLIHGGDSLEEERSKNEAESLSRDAGVLAEQDDEEQAMELGQAIIDQTPVADRETMESLTDVLRGLSTLEVRVKDENLGTELERTLGDAISAATNELESLSGE